jgi:signal peptidase II
LKRLNPHSSTEKKVLRQCFFLVGGLIILDHLTKILVIDNISLHDKIPVIPGCFNLVYVLNRGAAWGILSGYGWVLLAVSLLVLLFLMLFGRRWAEGWAERYYALALVAGGIAGNSIDRFWRQAVVDFLDFYLGAWHWPAFNVADSAITVGFAIFILSTLIRPPDAYKVMASQRKNGIPIFK